MIELSVLIPSRNEMFLMKTIEDILEHSEADTEIIAVLDGAWADPPIRQHPRVSILYHSEAVGQRAATNEAARVARGRWVMKCDAHCAFGQGFDRIMLEDIQPDWTMVPAMHNLHAFDWVCRNADCGHRQYQGPTPEACPDCGGPMARDMVWKPKPSPVSTAMRFDRNLKFKYWSGYKKRQGGADLRETMSLLGACWMLSKERYFELDICDENHGGWGQQGTEVACKSWLSGGKLICTTKTWFAHMFRTQGGDFGFPYPISGGDTRRARQYSQKLWKADNPHEMPDWDKAVHPLAWLIEKFAPVPDWEDFEAGAEEDPSWCRGTGSPEPEEAESEADSDALADALDAVRSPSPSPSAHIRISTGPTKAIVYYTDNRLDERLIVACQRQLEQAGLPIVCISLQPIEGFGHNIVVEGERGPLTMFRQILAGLEYIDLELGADFVFFAEHDVLYHPSHFDFVPEERDLVYYNNNVWKVDVETGRALFHYSNHTSQLCARRETLLAHYRRRVRICGERGFSRRMGFEPGTHGRAERVDDLKCATWMSEFPNLDLRHGGNLTQTRWRKDEFRNQRFTEGWTEADHVPPWYEAGAIDKLWETVGRRA